MADYVYARPQFCSTYKWCTLPQTQFYHEISQGAMSFQSLLVGGFFLFEVSNSHVSYFMLCVQRVWFNLSKEKKMSEPKPIQTKKLPAGRQRIIFSCERLMQSGPADRCVMKFVVRRVSREVNIMKGRRRTGPATMRSHSSKIPNSA